ncbi:MAG: hypothetical protein ACREFQ_17525 [Stellaceae bacterium]
MGRPVTIMSVSEIELVEAGSTREGHMRVKQFPLETYVPEVIIEFSWNSYDTGYGTPRHKHTFDQFRYALTGDREIKDGYLEPGDCGFYPEAVPYGPQLQHEPTIGLGLQFTGASLIRYVTHAELREARRRLAAEGGTFSGGVYTKLLPDGRKINKDSHAACWEAITGHPLEFPEPRYETPIVMHEAGVLWTRDRRVPGVEHKRLGSFGNSGARLMRLEPGARIPARREEDAEIRYLIDGSIAYDGKSWAGGKTADRGTCMWVPANADVKEIASAEGGTFFIIELPILADLEAQGRGARAAAE